MPQAGELEFEAWQEPLANVTDGAVLQVCDLIPVAICSTEVCACIRLKCLRRRTLSGELSHILACVLAAGPRRRGRLESVRRLPR